MHFNKHNLRKLAIMMMVMATIATTMLMMMITIISTNDKGAKTTNPNKQTKFKRWVTIDTRLCLVLVIVTCWRTSSSSLSSLCAICSQQVGCHGSPSFSILCHSDTVIIWYFYPFLDVIRPHCSRSPSSSSTIYPSFHQQSLYPISSYYMSKILTFPFFDSI